MTYESVFEGQAEMKKFFKSTFSERKIMSTKTSFKRIAAVAAVALTLGGFSAVSANAAVTGGALFPTVTSLSAPATGTVGTAVTGTFLQSGVVNAYGADSLYTQAYLTSIPATSALAPNSVTVANYSGTSYTNTTGTTETATNTNVVNGDTNYNAASWLKINTSLTSGTARINGYFTAAFTPDAAGTYTIAVKSLVDATQLVTWTITVAAPDTAIALTSSTGAANVTSLMAAGDTTTVGSTDATVAALKTASTTAAATIVVSAVNAAGTSVNSGLVLTATTTAGSVSIGTGTGQTPKGRSVVGAANASVVQVFADGTNAVATVTITGTTAGSTTAVALGTKKVTFYGAAAAISTPVLSVNAINGATAAAPLVAVANTGVLTATVTDAAGIAVPNATVYVVSADKTKIADQYVAYTSSSAGLVTASLSGLAQGTTTVTATLNSSATGTSTVSSATTSVRVGSNVIAKQTAAFDAATYTPGQFVTWTISAVDAAGLAVTDGTAVAWSLTSSTLPLGGSGTALASTYKAGVATLTFYAPLVAGTLTVKGSDTSGTTAVVTTQTAEVAGGAAVDAAQAAQDAANEATDAANAATDAANNAMDSADAAQQAAMDAGDKADAALAAVTDLATKVSEIASQISALSALVAKIAAAVAKISAKVKA
jgi:hypothetical protein